MCISNFIFFIKPSLYKSNYLWVPVCTVEVVQNLACCCWCKKSATIGISCKERETAALQKLHSDQTGGGGAGLRGSFLRGRRPLTHWGRLINRCRLLNWIGMKLRHLPSLRTAKFKCWRGSACRANRKIMQSWARGLFLCVQSKRNGGKFWFL